MFIRSTDGSRGHARFRRGPSWCDLHFIRSGSLVGTVVNTAGGAPVPGATATAGSVSAVTDAFGNFVISVAAGSYPVTIAKPGWNSTTTAAQIVVTGDETNAGMINLTAQAVVPGTITGTVIDAAGGSPVAGATVSAVGGSASATTDASGAFSLVESPGSYPLLVTRLRLGGADDYRDDRHLRRDNARSHDSLSATAGTVTGIVVDVDELRRHLQCDRNRLRNCARDNNRQPPGRSRFLSLPALRSLGVENRLVLAGDGRSDGHQRRLCERRFALDEPKCNTDRTSRQLFRWRSSFRRHCGV